MTQTSPATEPELDIVIPVYNEGENILLALEALRTRVRTPFRVLICYDFDEDNTLAALKTWDAEGLEVVPVKNAGQGPHGAVLTGFDASTAPAVVVYMADDDFNADVVNAMVAKFKDGCDVVAASRFAPGGKVVGCPWFKNAVTIGGAMALNILGRVPVRDGSNAFRLFSRRILDTVALESDTGFTFSIELLVKAHRLRWKVDEVPAEWYERTDKPSRFKVVQWLPAYIRWLLYALATAWLFRGPETVRTKGGA